MYGPKIINLFANAENVGILQSASGVGVYTNPTTNEVFKMYLKIENNYIVNASFKAYTGVAGVAVMSTLTEMLKNMAVENTSGLVEKDILKELDELDKKFEYLLTDALESLRLAITDYQSKLEKENAQK